MIKTAPSGRTKAPQRQPRQEVTPLSLDALDRAADALFVKLLTPREAADLLSVTTRTLERWRMTGQGPEFVSLSRGTVRYTSAALAAFVAGSVKLNTAQR